jgi:hypothetical protein
MLERSGGFSVRTILRAILAMALLLGSGVGDWAPAAPAAHESCCCGAPVGTEDSCPCPKPDGNRSPSQAISRDRVAVAAPLAERSQVERRAESRPEPASWAQTEAASGSAGLRPRAQGRDPDLGRHLARLHTLLI